MAHVAPTRHPVDMDPSTQVALALHHAPGVYAVLLGSGVSRGAGVPTGWEVTLDLVRVLARAEEGEDPDDLEAWYQERYGGDLDYSDILEQLAPTPAERQALLRSYFEPTEEERAEGVKIPSDAHRAVAKLAGAGRLRVILTTNFDRLIEQALDAEGVAHDVWSSADAIAGGVPLTHGRVVVVKLHGDYRDTRLRNTLTELEEYEPAITDLLDRVLDEFGLIICGWSGAWDAALRDAIKRTPNRRYRIFWTTVSGQLPPETQELAEHRDAVLVPIEDADSFFAEVLSKAEALADLDRPHPQSVELAVAMLKRYLPDVRDRIRLSDLIMDEAVSLREALGPATYPVQVPELSWEDAAVRVRSFISEAQTMMHVLAQAAALGDREDVADLLARALEVIANPEGEHSGKTVLLNLRRYPALLCFYAAGVGATSSGNWGVLRTIALDPVWRDLNDDVPLVAALHPYRVFESAEPVAQVLATGEAQPAQRRYTPVSDHLYETLQEPLMKLTRGRERYDEAFDRFEYLSGVLLTRLGQRRDPELDPFIPSGYVGRIQWRRSYLSQHPVLRWADENGWTIASELLGHEDTPQDAWAAARESYDEKVSQASRERW